MSLSQSLLERAKAGLSNPDEVTIKETDKAMAEAVELVGNKDITNAEKIDLGYFRLMLIMGLELAEIEMKMYDKLLSRIDKAGTVKTDAETGKAKTTTQKAMVTQAENIYA